MVHQYEYISSPHGIQNYHRPRQQLIKKEVLVGPVTAVALPSFAYHDDSKDHSKSSTQAFLVARGPFVELTFDDSMRKETYRFLAFSGAEGGTVHGMKKCVGTVDVGNRNMDLWLFYGGRRVSLVFLDPQPANLTMSDDEYSPFTHLPIESQETISESYQACDWIWDVRSIRVADPKPMSDNGSSFRVLTALGLAHNSVEILSFTSNRKNGKLSVVSTSLRKIVCDIRCITYSLNFFGWKPVPSNNISKQSSSVNLDLAVVVGTVSNEVLVWNVLDENEDIENRSTIVVRKKVLHRLLGHEGVIHSVKVGFGGKYLVSTSDDRTVRLWGQLDNAEKQGARDATRSFESYQDVRHLSTKECDFKLLWTAYGHSARVWDSDFISLNNDYFHNVCGGIVSVGEDSTVRIWKIDDGSELAILRGHGCQSIWKVVSNHSDTILTGGNDGTAKIWDVDHQLIHNSSTIKPCLEDNETSQPTTRIIEIPKDDVPTQITEPPPSDVMIGDSLIDQQSSGKKKRKKKKKIPVHRQTICGTCFYTADAQKRNLMVATRAGTLLSIELNTGKWITHGSWSKQGERDEQLVDTTKGSCIAVHPSGTMVAIGTAKGEIVLSTIKDRDHNDKTVFSDVQYPAIQSLHWLDPNNLLAFHIKGIVVWWRIDSDLSSTDSFVATSISQPYIRFVLSMVRDGLTVGIPMSYCHNHEKKIMFVGDSRGNLAVFDCTESKIPGCVRAALDVLSYTHRKEYVTGIIPTLDGEGVLSVGNDGFIHEATTKATSEGIKMFSVIRRPVPCLTGISHIWQTKRNGSPMSIVVAGYHGNKFIVWDQSVGYQLLSLDTGGRNRQLDLAIEFHCGLRSTSHHIAIIIANKNAPNEILLHSHSPRYARHSPLQYNLGEPCHGETVLDVAFCGTSSAGKTLLLSGSNDCTSKLYIVEENKIRLISELQPHESCVRAVCSSQHNGSKSSLLVVTGGKLLSTFYRADEFDDGTYRVTFLCTNKLQETPAIDQRMNAVDAVPFFQKSQQRSHLIVSGDSDGGLHLATVTEQIGQPRRLTTFKLAQGNRPILSIKMKRISEDHILLCVGNTAGDVAIWLLPGSIAIDPFNLPKTPIYVYRGNQVGTNCIALAFASTDKKCPKVLIINGGDDQAISCSIVSIDLGIDDHASSEICKVVTYKEACASAIKGITIAGDAESGFRVYTAGYDNRLSIWLLNPSQRLQFLSSAPIDIKDINTLDCCKLKDLNGIEKDLLVAGGEGIEILSFDISVWKAAQALKNCNYLLITCGAGFSADSGLSTYENMPDEYRELCNPLRLLDKPLEFQRFWHGFSQMYKITDPHSGYQTLEQWCNSKKLGNLITSAKHETGDETNTSPWWIYSSNVDGHFSRSNCFSDTICEIHGSATKFRCSHAIGISNGEKRQGALWDSWNERVANSSKSDQCSSNTFPVEDEEVGDIICKHCLLPARPNVLLFHDMDANMIDSISHHRDRYQKWEERVEDDVVQNSRHMVIIELGAGLNVPAVRNETEEVFNDTIKRLKGSRSHGTVTCIRINPKDAGFDFEEGSKHTISIYQKAEQALLMIDHILTISELGTHDESSL